MYDKYLDRIYMPMTSDPNVGRWFVSDNYNYTRFFDEYREIVHKVSPIRSLDYDEYLDGPLQDEMWTVSIGGPGNKFQVGYKYFNTTKEAKKWADNRTAEDLYELEAIVNNWRE